MKLNGISLTEAREEFIAGNSTQVRHKGNVVGELGKLKRSDNTIFLWNQKPFRLESSVTSVAYAMEESLIDKLNGEGVDMVFILDAGKIVDIGEIENGEIISPLDDRFNRMPDEVQRVVRVDRV